MAKLLKQINQEVSDFKTKNIHIVEGLTFNHYETLNRIYFHYNSKFVSGVIDSEGDRKYFYNINKNPCKVASKAIDFDTKHIRLLTAPGGEPTKTWFMERDLKYWMRDKKFGKVLNRIFHEVPIFGSVVLKIIEGTPYFVDLRNFIVEQSADSLDDSNHLIEVHNLTVGAFRKIANQMKWKDSDVEKVIEEFYKMKDVSHIKLYERYGTVEEEGLDGSKKYPYKRVFFADVGVNHFDTYKRLEVEHEGVELSSEEWEGHPYREFHFEKFPGRWLGVGVVETLFEPQIAENQHTNLQNKAASHLALLLFQTRDQAFNRNLLTDTANGEVLSTDSELTQVNISDRNLAYFNDQHSRWLNNRDELTFTKDAITGDRSPAGTPLGSTQLALSQTLAYFEVIQEELAMDVKEMLYQVVIPQFEKENSLEHTLRLVGRDLDTYIEMVKNEMVFKEIIRLASKGSFPTSEDRDAIALAVEESIKQEKEKLLKIPKNYYKGVKYDVDIDITGESIDTRVRYATKFAILQAITSDPTMTTDPIKRNILYSMAEDGGVNPHDLFDVEKKSLDQIVPPDMARAGGGVSAPAIGMQMPGATNTTV